MRALIEVIPVHEPICGECLMTFWVKKLFTAEPPFRRRPQGTWH
jgi:hypothetical protein